MTTLEEFQDFINENQLHSPKDFQNRFPKIYNRAKYLKYLKSIKYIPDPDAPAKLLNKLEDFQNFINDNKIVSAKDFYTRFFKIYRKMSYLRLCSSVKYPLPSMRRKQYGRKLKSVDDFKTFMRENKISSLSELRKTFTDVYWKVMRRRYSKLIFSKDTFSQLNTLEDFQEFVRENNIKTLTEFKRNFYQAYKRSRLLNIIIHFNPSPCSPRPKYSSKYIALGDFQRFVDNNKIISAGDFSKRFSKLYRKLTRLKLNKQIIYPKSGFCSSWEKYVSEILKKNNILHEKEFSFSDLRGKGSHLLRFDFYLPEYNILIEVQGPFHYFERTEKGEFIGMRKRDLKKNRYVKKKSSLKLFYYAHGRDGKYLVETYGYPYYVYTDIKLLLEDIKKNKE